MKIKNLAPYVTTLLLPFFLTACIEFEQQVMTYTIADDELTIFQEYHGIFGKDFDNPEKKKPQEKKTELTDAEKKEIHSVVNGERTFFFDNWITAYNRAELLETVTRLEHPEKELSASDKRHGRIWLPLINLLLANVTVTNGEFYYDAQRRLSAYQIVRVKNVKQLIEQANRSISLAILAEPLRRDADENERKSFTRHKALAEAGFAWIKTNGNRISVSFPATHEEFIKAGNEAQNYLGHGDQVVEVSYDDGLITIATGASGIQPFTISKQVQGPYSTNAVKHIATEYGIKERLDIPRLKQAAFE
jgi:hypothetical protein